MYRQGQTHPVIVHHLVVQDARDEDVMQALSENADVQTCLIDSLRVRLRKVREEDAA